MRALLYKDLVVHRGKTLPLWGAAGLACLLPAWLPMEGMLLPLVFGLTLPLLLFQQEAKEGWYQLVSQLPFAPRTVVGARYLVTALLCLWMGGCYGLGQAVSPPHPGLESCLAAGALAAAILLTLHAVALPLLYAFGPGETLSALLATMGLAAVVSWLAISLDEALLRAGRPPSARFWSGGSPVPGFAAHRGGAVCPPGVVRVVWKGVFWDESSVL